MKRGGIITVVTWLLIKTVWSRSATNKGRPLAPVIGQEKILRKRYEHKYGTRNMGREMWNQQGLA